MQTSIVGANVLTSAGSQLLNGLFNLEAGSARYSFAVSSGVIASGACVPSGTNATVTLSSYFGLENIPQSPQDAYFGITRNKAVYVFYLRMPNVSIAGLTWDWDNFIQASFTESSGSAPPWFAAQNGASYRQAPTLGLVGAAGNASTSTLWVYNSGWQLLLP